MKYVFVCHHGESRSPKAASIAEQIACEKGFELETDYFGVNDRRTNEEKRRILTGADKVFVMEEIMRFDIERILNYKGRIICLDIPDLDYLSRDYMDKKIRPHIEKPIPSL